MTSTTDTMTNTTAHYISSPLYHFLTKTATTDIYTLSLHDALPISCSQSGASFASALSVARSDGHAFEPREHTEDRKSTRLNSSHSSISYAVFCLKKKKTICLVGGRATGEVVAGGVVIRCWLTAVCS